MVHGRRDISLSTSAALLLALTSSFLLQASATSVSTNTQVPPLQWINLSNDAKGSKPPPLKDASIGYDSINNRIILFGGESQQGIAQSQTFILDLATLTWSQPQAPSNLQTTPPPRSGAISGQDSAASYRNGHVVIGGRGTDGNPLNDVWEFDYSNQFWSQVSVSGGPSARWGAAGGSDPRTSFDITALTNSYYVAGGFAAGSTASLSDVWRLDVSGTLSSNVQTLKGTWTQLHPQNKSLPAIGGSAHAVIMQSSAQHVIASGGCSTASGSTAACAQGQSFVINLGDSSNTAPGSCPAPRTGATLALNLNTASTSFATQAFLLLGTFDSSQWQDGGGLNKGEVDVLDISTGSWARIIPASDPSSSSEAVPSPREGAAVFTLSQAAVGSVPATDTIVFGGRDASGQYLDELWILRAYNGSVSSSGQHWSGYGNGQLEGGPTASGQGVTISYLTDCATQISSTSTTGSSSSSPTSPTSSGSPPTSTAPTTSSITVSRFDTSTIHKSLGPVSVALILPAIVFYRLSQPSLTSTQATNARVGFFYLTVVTALVAFALGIGGVATAFTSIQYTTSIVKRSGVPHLTTPHGRAGVALFVGLYGLVPALIAVSFLLKRKDDHAALAAKRQRTTSNDIAEKVGLRSGSPFTPDSFPQEPQPPERAKSGENISSWPLGHTPGTRRSSESAGDNRSSPSTRSFEVTNRPQRVRHPSQQSFAALMDPRRRSNGEIDYLNSQYNRRPPIPSTPGTTVLEGYSTKGSVLPDAPSPGEPIMPGGFDTLIHLLLHAFLIALCILSIIALFQRANIATFAVFIAWTACFYIVIAVMAWHGIPSESILTVFIARLKNHPGAPEAPPPQEGVPFPTAGNGPYTHHQPNYRLAQDADYPGSVSHHGHTVEDDYDDNEDDDVRQRRIEDEINRRDVSIVTVPKRKLVIINPEIR